MFISLILCYAIMLCYIILWHAGRNTHGRLVYFEGDYNKLKGEFVDVLITSAKMYSLYGQAVDNSEMTSTD